jgi:hypothetical protein
VIIFNINNKHIVGATSPATTTVGNCFLFLGGTIKPDYCHDSRAKIATGKGTNRKRK